jgi:serine/threonine protein kinase
LDSDREFCPVCALNSALQPDNHATTTELRFEHYQILQNEDQSLMEIGHGSMGVTYKALDVQLQRPVALKIINAKFIGDASARQRFVREARAAASVRHQNVASVYHLGEIGGDYFYAMEFVDGETLEKIIQHAERLSADLALEITAQVAAGLAAIHKQHLVHRDIKPSNIMVSLEEGRLESVKIIDLGLAKGVAEQETISAVGSFTGTPGYASPEQFAGLGADIRSDLYSLGITLWEMLSRKLPFQGSATELMYQHQHTAVPFEQLKGVPVPIVALLNILLEKDPSRRFQGPLQLQRALAKVKEAVVSGSRIGASELRTIADQTTDQSPTRPRRKRIARWLIASSVFATALLLGWFFFVANRGPFFNQRSADSAATERSIAVLPFENISPNKDDAYFADGVQDEILNNLAKIAQLKVISRTSVMQYRAETKRDLRQIATALGVANVLEGTVKRSGNRVRVSTQLVDARKDQTIWAESYDRDLTDIFTIQSDVAQAIAAKLTAALSPTEKKSVEARPTDNLEAYDLYLRGKESLSNAGVAIFSGLVETKEQLLQAIDFFGKAVRLDPNFVLAYCASANANSLLYFWFDATPERLARADAAIDAALRLRPDLPEVHLAQARHLYHCYRDYDGARVQLAIAKSGFPNNVEVTTYEAFIDRRQGNWQKAIQGLNESVARDPRNVATLNDLAQTLWCTRKFDAVAPLYDRLIDLRPDRPILKVNKAINTRYLKAGDTGAVWSAIAALPPSAAADPDVLDTRLSFSLIDHDWTQAEWIIGLMKGRKIATPCYGRAEVPVEYYAVLIARLREDQPVTSASFAGLREQLSPRVSQAPKDAGLLSSLAVLDALLNNKEAAISEAKRATEILPVSKDALDGPDVLINLAVVYAWSGQLDQAFAVLEPLTELPNGIFYGELKRDPLWEPLRQDPRYNRLLDKLAPKD